MQYLIYINNYFINLSKFQKIEVYLIITLLIFSLYMLNKKEARVVYSSNIDIKKITYLEILYNIEKWSKNNKIKINTIDLSSSVLIFNINSKLDNIINFLFYIQSLTTSNEISNLRLFYNKEIKKFELELSISFNNIKEKSNLVDLKTINVFKSYKKRKYLSLNAIYGKYLIINHKIYTLNDKYKDYKIIEIKKDRIILFKSNNKLKVYNVGN